MNRLIIVGSGGHAGVVINAIEERVSSGFEIAGLLDDFATQGEIKHRHKILGPVNTLERWLSEFRTAHVFIAIGDGEARKKILGGPLPGLIKFPAIVHPSAVICNAKIGEGTFIGAGAIVGNGCDVGGFAIINTRASLDHDSSLGDFSHLAPGVVTGGHVHIGSNTFIGMGTLVRDHTSIGSNCSIKMASAVIKDIPDNTQLIR